MPFIAPADTAGKEKKKKDCFGPTDLSFWFEYINTC